ncbi:MAG: hypothetical protein IK075_04890 [Prevotella sp.]|nr:hypothetical protein [Prevotella sp.]
MKRYLILAMMCLTGLAIQAQTKVLINLANGSTKEYDIQKVDSMIWDKITISEQLVDGLIIYLNDKTKVECAISEVTDIKWSMEELPDQTIVKNGITLTNPQSFVVNEYCHEVKSTTCTVSLSSTVVKEDTKLVIRESLNPEKLQQTVDEEFDEVSMTIGTDARVIDVELDGIHELDGVATIRIPYTETDYEKIGAAYYNEETKEWESVCHYYDKNTNEVVIITDHLSEYGVFKVKNEHTRNETIKFNDFPKPTDDPTNYGELIINTAKFLTNAYLTYEDFMADTYGKINFFANDLCYNLIQTAGINYTMLDELNNGILLHLGVALSAYEICRAAQQGNKQQLAAGVGKMVLQNPYVMNQVTNFLGSAAMSAGMFAVALIDYSLKEMMQSAWKDRQDLYRKCYNYYYTHDNKKSKAQWYKELLPLFKQQGATEESVKTQIDKIINDYVWSYWSLTDGTQEIMWQEIGGKAGSYFGGINQNLKEQLCDNYKTVLYNDTLKSVFKDISDQLEYESYKKAKDAFVKYTEIMNRKVVLTIQDCLASEKSKYAGCKVRFQDLDKTELKDPEKWECTLGDKGTGKLVFRLYPYVHEGVKPVIEIYTENDGKIEILKEIPITISKNNQENIIDINEGSMNGLKLKEFSNDEVEYTYSDYTSPIYWDEAHDALYVEIKCRYDDGEGNWQTDPACSLPIWLNDIDKGIKEAFEKYNSITYAEDGTIGIANKDFIINGTFVPMEDSKQPKSGSGTFKLNYKKNLNFKTVDEVTAFWHDYTQFRARLLDFMNPILNAKLDQQIEGAFTFEWNEEDQVYVFKFSGRGPYEMAGSLYTQIDNVDPFSTESGGGFLGHNEYAVCSNTENFSMSGEALINFEISYEMVNMPDENGEGQSTQ